MKTKTTKDSFIKVILKKDLKEEFDSFGKKVDKRFEQVDKRFEQVDKRFEQVDKRFDSMEKSFKLELKLSIENLEDKIEQKISKFTNSILTAVDPLLKELEQRQQDREIASDQTARLKNQVDNHEDRIKGLEKAQIPA